MAINKPTWPVNRWLTGMLRQFRPQIEALVQQRDERVRAWQRQYPDVNTFEDRRLEVTSQVPVDVDAQVALLESRLAR
jgi:hypothetical protein